MQPPRWQTVRSVFGECEVEFSCGEPGGGGIGAALDVLWEAGVFV